MSRQFMEAMSKQENESCKVLNAIRDINTVNDGSAEIL